MAISLIQAEKTDREDFLSSMRSDSGDCHVLELDHESQIVLLCNLQTQEPDECLQIANRIRQKAIASKIDLKIGIGRRTEDFTGIHLSYQGALCALESYDHGKIVLFDHVVSHFSVLEKYPSEDVLNFIQYVKLGRKEDALHILDRIARLTEMNYASRLIQQYVCYDIVSLFLKSVDKSVMLLSPDETSRLLNFHNVDSLFEQLKEKVATVCDVIAFNKQNENRKLTQSIIDYVDQHFIEEDICLTNVADQFNISMYTLSRLFKEAAGIGFKEYVTGKRMEMSKNLLLSTPKSVKEISAAVGYNDVSYYIKLFKNLEGVTPIGFREMISVQIADQ